MPYDKQTYLTSASPDPDALRRGELLYIVHELSRLISMHFDKVMEPHGVTRAQWWALMHVMLNEGQSQSELARLMQMGRSAAGKQFDRLEESGWIERRSDEEDQRLLRVFLSDGALPALAAMMAGGPMLFDTLLDGFSEEDESVLLTGLRRIRANAEKALGLKSRGGLI